MGKKKHSPEWMIARVQEYLSGQGSHQSIASANGISKRAMEHWVQKYREHGEAAFFTSAGNKHYSQEFKIKCVEAVLSGEGSVDDIVAKYNISDRSVLRCWVFKYNANIELKDYDPKREAYMAEARRKTTLEERKEITEYCIKHGRDYKGTAVRYDVSYSQVYSWVKKYDEKGEEALKDNRGHHKTDEEVDEMERLRRENLRLKRQLEEKDMLVELLKKVKEFEGM
mgnify:CR=1 FL=1